MSKISVYKNRGKLVKKQTYVVDFDVGALQNVSLPKLKVIEQGELIKEAPFESVQSFDPESGIDAFDSVIREAFAVSVSLNFGDALFAVEEVLVLTDNITALRAEIVAAITGDVAITSDAVIEAILVDQNNEFETM
jgi:hypothetical protein